MFDLPVVVVDVETTSLDSHDRVVWDVGMVKISTEGDIIAEKQFFIELTQRELDKANPESLDIGGYDERFNGLEAYSKATAAHMIKDFTDGCYLAGICVDFDAVSLENTLRAVGLRPGWDYHLLDVRTLAAGYLKAKELSGPLVWGISQDEVAELLNVDTIEEIDRHTAIGDAQYGAAILLAII
jgi:DNA polymerase III alpha subunit (gram-positive type)